MIKILAHSKIITKFRTQAVINFRKNYEKSNNDKVKAMDEIYQLAGTLIKDVETLLILGKSKKKKK